MLYSTPVPAYFTLQNKKLSYHRDSACQRLLRHSMSLKATHFGIIRKLVCDFLFVNNTNFHTILHHFQVIG